MIFYASAIAESVTKSLEIVTCHTHVVNKKVGIYHGKRVKEFKCQEISLLKATIYHNDTDSQDLDEKLLAASRSEEMVDLTVALYNTYHVNNVIDYVYFLNDIII